MLGLIFGRCHIQLDAFVGAGTEGRLGTGSTSDVTVPTPVASTAGVTSGWAAISAGSAHTCAIADSTRAAFCWGESWGECMWCPCSTLRCCVPCVLCNVGGRSYLWQVSQLDAHAGYGADGHLGIAVGSTSSVTVPTPVASTAGVTSGWVAISAGGSHTCAIADSTRAAFCWGECWGV